MCEKPGQNLVFISLVCFFLANGKIIEENEMSLFFCIIIIIINLILVINQSVSDWVRLQLSAFKLNGNVCDYLVYLGHFLGQETMIFWVQLSETLPFRKQISKTSSLVHNSP